MPIFDKEHADLMVALIGEKSDIQAIFGLMPQKIAVVHFHDSDTCLSEFNTGAPFPAEFILLDATGSFADAEQFIVEFRRNDIFEKIPVVVMADTDADDVCQRFIDLGANFCSAKLDVLANQSSLSQIITDYWMSG